MQSDVQLSWKHDDSGYTVIHISRFQLQLLLLSLPAQDAENFKPTVRHLRRMLLTTEQERLYADLFNSGYKRGLDVEEMPFTQLESWIEELERIIFEAKATLHGADLAKRERHAKLNQSEKDKTRTQVDSRTYSVSDSIATVKRRAERMTKMDKLEDHLRNQLGLSEEDIKATLSKVKIKEEVPKVSNSAVPSSSSSIPAIVIGFAWINFLSAFK